MKAFWVRVFIPLDGFFSKHIDSWCSGTSDKDKVILFSVLANNEEDITTLLMDTLDCGFKIDSCSSKEWKTYRDFCGNGTRWPMADKYLDEKIDSISDIKNRLRVKK